MPTERMEEVEVVCGMCKGEGVTDGYPGYAPQGGPDGATYTCFVCQGAKALPATIPSGSLTAARLRLADAAEAREVAHRKRMARIEMGLDCSVDREYLEALAAEEDAEDQEVEAFEALAALRTARGEG